MTEEQVEELHAQHALVVGNDRECPHGERQGYCDRCEYEHSILYDIVLNALPRLLEERKRLEEAASNVRISLLMLLENPDDPPTTATLAEYAKLLGNALSFASSPAP